MTSDTFISFSVWKAKLFLLWWRRIIFAPDHFAKRPLLKLHLALHGGYVLDQYYIYDFKHNDRREYLSEFDWYRSRNINKPYDMMCNNKVNATEVLEQYVRVPRVLMQKNHGKIVSLAKDIDRGFLTSDDAADLLDRTGTLYLKPLAAGKGKGVYRLTNASGAYYIDDQRKSRDDLRRFLDKQDGWFLSEGITQGAFGRALYPDATHTIRFITLRDPETGHIKPFFAVQRIGTSETAPVDNGSRGGLVARINMDTGELSEAKCLQKLGSWDRHPDSGAQIKGAVIPRWQDVKRQMVDLARKLPFMNFIAWDILLTDEGISIIEANTSSGVNIIQLWGPQRNGELGRFYRAHGCIK